MVHRFFVAFFALVAFLPGQNLNLKPATPAAAPSSKIEIRFTAEEASSLYATLIARTDPALLENAYFSPELRNALNFLRTHMLVLESDQFPPNWTPGSLTFSIPKWCPSNIGTTVPCVMFYPNSLMASIRMNYPLLRQPDEAMKNSFAVYTGHEPVHFADGKGPEFWTTMTEETKANEEVRAWYRTTIDFVEPLAAAHKPLWQELVDMNDWLKACGNKLPCQKFEQHVRQTKVYR